MPKNKKSSPEPETKEFIKPKQKYGKYIWAAFALLVAGSIVYLIYRPKNSNTYTQAYTVVKQDVRQTVIATGTVSSQTDLDLSFKTSGILSKLSVNVGDKVKAGQVLASLDATDAQASVQVAQAAVESARVALNNAKNNLAVVQKQQQTLVDNAYATMLSSGLTALNDNSANTVTATISGTYTGKDQGEYAIKPYLTGNGYYFNVSGLESATAQVTDNIPIPLGTKGLFITFSSTNLSGSGTWTVEIPNLKSSTYLTNSNAYQAALQTQEQQVTTASGAVDTQQAALTSAQAQLVVAQNAYNNYLLKSPITGIVTSVDDKIGEQIVAQKEVIVVLDPKSLHVETEIPESSITQIVPGQNIDMTFDALGPDTHLQGQVVSIDPASSVIAGVIDFRVVSSLPNDARIKPGMTVNVNILIADQPDVLAVPSRLIKTVAGKQFVSIYETNSQAKDVEISTGLVGDNFTEITSGLSGGENLAQVVVK